MTVRMHRKTTSCMLIFLAVALVGMTGCRKPTDDMASTRVKTQASIQKGRDWVKSAQNEDGTFGNMTDPKVQGVKIGMTALATIALMDQGLDENDPNVKRAIAFIAARQGEDGSICMQEASSNYETALTAIALKKTGNAAYDDALTKAQTFLKSLQGGAKGEIDLTNPMYGGFGYGSKGYYDLSNTQFALEALRTTELGADDETFKRTINFIERCQNLQKANKQSWATNDGGFVYFPGFSQASPDAKSDQPRRSYGSMTYAGLLSFSYCDVPKDDPRVQAALAWLREHYTLDENPGMGQQGLYYYYMVMAKALSAIGETYIVDNEGRRHHWAADLADRLVSLQHADGYWVNDKSDRWMENNKSLVTAYCMIALNRCQPFLAESATP